MTQLCRNGRRRLGIVYALLAGCQQRREVRMNGEPVVNAPEIAGLRSRPLSEIERKKYQEHQPNASFPTHAPVTFSRQHLSRAQRRERIRDVPRERCGGSVRVASLSSADLRFPVE